MPFPILLGPYYSEIRYAIIGSNLFGMLIAAAIAFAFRPVIQLWAGIACALLALVWLFIGAINSVV
jgi:hypothetical protein